MLGIRAETAADFPAVREVNRLAFGRDAEAGLVDALRATDGYIPSLSRVAVVDGRIVGHILFTRIGIVTAGGVVPTPTLALAPMAVLPEHQNRGVGSALVRDGLETCRRLGHGSVIVLGHPAYYPRFGFVPARPRGIAAPFPAPDEAFMLIELVPGALNGVQGTVQYPPAFSEV